MLAKFFLGVIVLFLVWKIIQAVVIHLKDSRRWAEDKSTFIDVLDKRTNPNGSREIKVAFGIWEELWLPATERQYREYSIGQAIPISYKIRQISREIFDCQIAAYNPSSFAGPIHPDPEEEKGPSNIIPFPEQKSGRQS